MGIIPKEAQKMPEWLNIVFYVSLLLLLISIIGYFVLSGYHNKAVKYSKDLDLELASQKTDARLAMEKEVLGYKDKINDFTQILDSRLKGSEIFESFQKLCHPKVSFSQFNLDVRKRMISASGEAQSFSVLGQQLLIYQQDPLVESVDVSQISIDKKGKIGFSLNLNLKSQ